MSLADTQELLGAGLDAVSATALYEESGGNPFYLEQLARALGRGGTPFSPIDDMLVTVGVPRAVVAALTEELGLLADARGSSSRVRPSRAIRSSPSSSPRRPTSPEAEAVDALDELLEPTSCARPTSRADSASGTRSSVERSTTPRRGAGDWARTSAAPRRSPTAERRRRHAPTTSSARPARATSRRSRSCAKPGAQRRSGRRRAPHAGSAQRLRLLGDDAPAEERVELLTALAGAQAATGQFAEARAALLESIESCLRTTAPSACS